MAESSRGTLQGTSMMPSLTVDDLQRSMSFFEGLGFSVTDRWEDKGKLMGVTLSGGSVQLGISQDDGKKGQGRAKGVGMRLYIETTANIDEIASRAKAAGVTLAKEPHDTEWGARAFDVTEPSGFLLTVASRLTPA